ncbi:unnamed protein product, partial [marine sediment metagenome]
RRAFATVESEFDGRIADVRIYNRALAAPEILELASGKLGAVPNGLVAYWLPFGQLIDAAGSDTPVNHGTADSGDGPPVYGSF